MVVRSGFSAASWLANPHLQTLFPVLFRRRSPMALRRQRLELVDGDFLDLCWTPGDAGPIVVVLHGLEGSVASHYVGGLLRAVHERGWRGVLMHFRGCSGEPNRLPRGYHSGDTGDVAALIDSIRQREAQAPIAAVGYSMGGNVLLKWLGETGGDNPLTAAVAVSVPFLLADAASRLERGFSRVYQRHLMRRMNAGVRRKFARVPCPLDLDGLSRLHTFRQFDDYVTAPLHGFSDADDYYRRSSSRQYLRGIRVPTLIVHALDDPFMTPAAVPGASELAPSVTLELSDRGGHVGFVAGSLPWRPRYWLDQRATGFLREALESEKPAGGCHEQGSIDPTGSSCEAGS